MRLDHLSSERCDKTGCKADRPPLELPLGEHISNARHVACARALTIIILMLTNSVCILRVDSNDTKLTKAPFKKRVPRNVSVNDA